MLDVSRPYLTIISFIPEPIIPVASYSPAAVPPVVADSPPATRYPLPATRYPLPATATATRYEEQETSHDEWAFLNHEVRRLFQPTAWVIDAAGRSFRDWPNFNFWYAGDFNLLQNNAIIELTIASDGSILNTAIISSSGSQQVDNNLLNALNLASFVARQQPYQRATLTINF